MIIEDPKFDHNDYEFQQDTMTSNDNIPFFDWNEWQSPEQILENARAFVTEHAPNGADKKLIEEDAQTIYATVMEYYYN